jgi:signal transduction histidine kinase
VLGIVGRRQAWLNLLYLLSPFPTGMLYLLVIVALVCVQASIVGLVVILFSMRLWRGLASFERGLAIWWLGVEIAPMADPVTREMAYWQRTGAYLRDRVTWSSLGYLAAKLPLGAISFTITFALVGVSAALIAAPLPFAIGALVDGHLDATRTALLAISPLLTLLGLALGIATLYAANGMAWLWGWFAQISLGTSDTVVRLAEARATAERERTKAERSEQSRRELIVNVSHELRTPIASIRGHVEALLLATDPEAEGTLLPEELRSYLGIVARESERLSALVDDLLALARADASELRLDVQPISVAEVVEEVFQTLAPLARRERRVTLAREVAPGLPLALADRERLTQVLLNLVRNAITYTPPGGIVSLSASAEERGWLTLIVADTGIGIPPEDLQRIFERFYRTDASRARATGGFGLGLAVVRDLVDAMGGTVSAESHVGEGSRFRVRLRAAGTTELPGSGTAS